ncbi:MAG: hypothetical protein ACLSAH_18785 [Bilophila wadsworthia]
MTIPQLHMYDLKTGEYTGSRDATRRPNGSICWRRPVRRPLLPADIPAGHIARWTDAWEAVEDHRQHMDERGRKGRRDALLASGDTWRSEPRYAEELGPLPRRRWRSRKNRPRSWRKRRRIRGGLRRLTQST